MRPHTQPPGRRRRSPGGDPLESIFLAELARPIAAPDLTRPILRRLGLTGSSSKDSRWRILGGVGRAVMNGAMLLGVVVGLRLYNYTVAARVPLGPTVPSAIQHDYTRHEHTIRRAIRMIRDLSPRRPAEPALEQPPISPSTGRSRDSRGAGRSMRPPLRLM